MNDSKDITDAIGAFLFALSSAILNFDDLPYENRNSQYFQRRFLFYIDQLANDETLMSPSQKEDLYKLHGLFLKTMKNAQDLKLQPFIIPLYQ